MIHRISQFVVEPVNIFQINYCTDFQKRKNMLLFTLYFQHPQPSV